MIFYKKIISVFIGLLFIQIAGFTAYAQKTLANKGIDTNKTTLSEQLDQLVVTGTRTSRTLKSVPVITRLISSQEIKKESPRSLSDLLETELPGLEFTRTEGVSNSITFMGMGANYLLILVDGERMAGETQRSNPDFNRIDIDNVERIEIVKGAMSTLYGSGAIAGVINIITKNASKKWESKLDALYSGEGEQRYGANIGAKLNVGKRGELTSFTSGVANLKEKYFFKDTEIEGYENFSVSQKFGYNIPNKLKLSATGKFYNHQRYNAGKVGELTNDVYRDWNLLLKAQYDLNLKNRIEVSYNTDNYTKYAKYFKLSTKEQNYKDVIHNPKIMFSTESIKNNSLVAGAELLSEKLQSYQFSGSDKSATQVAVFAQDEYNISKRLSVMGGLRLDYHSSFNGLSLTPKISLMYKVGSALNQDDKAKNKSLWIFRLSYSAGYRTPTLKELYTSWDHQGMFVLIGNPNLKPEKSNNFQASAELALKNVNISATAFYNYIYDKISTVWNSRQDTSFYSNIDNAKIYGADVNIKVNLSKNFALKAGYAYVNDRQLVNGYNTSSTRPHSATFRFEYNFNYWKCPFTVGLNGRYLGGVSTWSQSDNNIYEENRYEAYTIWKMNVVATLPYGIKANIGVNNIFNYKPKVVTYNAGITRGTTVFAGISISLDKMFEK